MSAFEDAVIQRIKQLEREVERLQRWERPTGGGGVTDHGDLTGLADDDHPQYLLTTGKAADSDKLDGVDITAFKGLNSLADPNADRVLFWDDSAGTLKWLTVSTGLALSDTSLALSHLGLQSLTDPDADRVLFWDDSAGALKWLTLGTGLTITGTEIKPSQPQFYPLTTPLTSTSWDGDAYSSGGPTLIDTSAVFGAPAGIKAAAVRLTARDSAVFGTGGLYLIIGPSSSYCYAVSCYPFGGDVHNTAAGIVPCDANGDFYYKIVASGSLTLDAWIEIWGYWL